MPAIKGAEWQKYIERRNSIFYVSIFDKAYGTMLKQEAGFGFSNQVYVHNKGVFTFYKTKEELEDSDRHFAEIIKKDKKKIREWHSKGIYYISKEENLAKVFNGINDSAEIISAFQKHQKELHEIFLYLTTIPFVVLPAAEKLPEKEAEEIISLFEKFRNKSRNLLQEQVFRKVWKAASQKLGSTAISPEDFSYYTIDEFNAFLEQGKTLSNTEIAKRKEFCIFIGDKEGNIKFYYDPSFRRKIGLKEDLVTIESNISELKGSIAFKGNSKGIAKIINKPEDMKKFSPGDIIISVNTTPSLMPVLAKASAIVTDEGGLTCHASLLSRELKIPCIVGTKLATKVFKDGDLVEVDAKKGIIKRIR